MDYLLQMNNISKTFGEVKALQNINFELGYNEIVGLVGDNGAGKSTLIKIITGYHHPDPGGEFLLKGKKVEEWSVEKARQFGIETVYQERALADKQPLWRNIFMGREISNRFGLLDIRKMSEETQNLMLRTLGFTSAAVSADSLVKTMSGGERQGVAITRALYFNAELIILDEPTMGLSLSETRKCLEFVEDIKKAGKSCIFIDHNIFHVYPVVDRIVVLDRGSIAGQFSKEQISLDDLMAKLYLVAQTGKLNSQEDNNEYQRSQSTFFTCSYNLEQDHAAGPPVRAANRCGGYRPVCLAFVPHRQPDGVYFLSYI
jgi:simple sugar transport system ATP-binding protein